VNGGRKRKAEGDKRREEQIKGRVDGGRGRKRDAEVGEASKGRGAEGGQRDE